MSHCRFENRLSGSALEMRGLQRAIHAHRPEELDTAFAAIHEAQRQGMWHALLLDYEVGEWLEPAAKSDATRGRTVTDTARPRFTALAFDACVDVPIWPADTSVPAITSARATIEKSQYLEAVNEIRAAIARGDVYQVNYTFPIEITTHLAPQALYRNIAARHPAAHCAYIEDGARRILSFSPELFLERRGERVTVRPMKGTAPRHPDPALDERAMSTLKNSKKDKAENLMIVDLLRNDLGRIAGPGSVKVDALFSMERYPSVWTMTSTISASAPDVSFEALLRALFPCGSITGAPKIAAMRKIQALESTDRGIYCGSVGWLAPNGDCAMNVAIRSIEMHNDSAGVFGVGGGIVYDSEPELEWQECHWKARILGCPVQSY